MKLCFENVYLQALGMALPQSETTSFEIEERLAPTYERLGLVPGRLELMTGIRARRHFPVGTLPSDIATGAAEDLFSRCALPRDQIDCLIHASVCRDFLEPATATVVHHRLGLSPSCLLFDLSNACLSWMNALVVASGLIESGQARSVLVVCGEDSRSVVDNTIEMLNENSLATRQSLKPSLATLTLGSGGAAALLSPNPSGARVLGGSFSAATQFHDLCRGGSGQSSPNDSVLMQTDSEAMLQEGVALAARTWTKTKEALNWSSSSPSVYFTHQVGSAHRRLMIEKLELPPGKDFSTFDSLGNMGAASIGVTLTLGARAGRIPLREPVALLGIGSGLVCGMLGMQWAEGVSF